MAPAAFWVAKNLVAAGAATRLEVQVSYAIGVAEPVSIRVHTFGTSDVSETELAGAISDVFDFTPLAIIDRLGLRSAIYTATAAYGHFGRDPEVGVPDAGGPEVQFFPWEITDRVDDLRAALGG